MKFKTQIFPIFAVVLLSFPLLYAHGVMGRIDAGGIVVRTMYDSGEAMSYAKVTISAPEAKMTFQTGRTDRNGRFCFFPDIRGEWKVVVDDEMGHRLEFSLSIDEALALQEDPEDDSTGQKLSRAERAVMGISIIFGVSGVLFWWNGRKGRAS